jgi:hypothetical protein
VLGGRPAIHAARHRRRVHPIEHVVSDLEAAAEVSIRAPREVRIQRGERQ